MGMNRLDVLDGWRGLSILFVLAAHLLPLGPKFLALNASSGLIGMALFFTLSGFLITAHFLRGGTLGEFFIRRFFRIAPLAWLGVAVASAWGVLPSDALMSHLLFYANWPPMSLSPVTAHYWSLCVEVQFYLGVALIFAIFRNRFFWPLLFLCLSVTIFRVYHGAYAAINTYFRVDEILAGSLLAFIYFGSGRWSDLSRRALQSIPLMVLILALFLASHEIGGWLNYFRPYIAAALVGATLVKANTSIHSFLESKGLVYVAAISFALYVIHPFLGESWLGEGDRVERYLKRIPLFLVLWALAHISTFYFEKKFMQLGKSLSAYLCLRSVKPMGNGSRGL